MRQQLLRYGVCCLVFLCGNMVNTVVWAQDNSQVKTDTLGERTFEEATWQTLQEELDYSGEPPPKVEQKEKEEAAPLLSPAAQVILLVVLVGLLLWLVYSLVIKHELKIGRKKRAGNDKNAGIVSLQRLEEELDQHDVLPLLAQAEQAGDYHLAIRLHYLNLLKQLNESKRIRWKKDLTNSAYLRQMRQDVAFAEFRALTQVFERVWYGNQVPTATEYPSLKAQFEAFSMGKNAAKALADG